MRNPLDELYQYNLGVPIKKEELRNILNSELSKHKEPDCGGGIYDGIDFPEPPHPGDPDNYGY